MVQFPSHQSTRSVSVFCQNNEETDRDWTSEISFTLDSQWTQAIHSSRESSRQGIGNLYHCTACLVVCRTLLVFHEQVESHWLTRSLTVLSHMQHCHIPPSCSIATCRCSQSSGVFVIAMFCCILLLILPARIFLVAVCVFPFLFNSFMCLVIDVMSLVFHVGSQVCTV